MTTANATTEDTLRIVKSIVEEMLQERFSKDDITFTEIKVENLIDYMGEDYISIKVFYTGSYNDINDINSKWTISMPRLIGDEMERRGLVVEKNPRDTFINQEEWDEIKDWNFWDEID